MRLGVISDIHGNLPAYETVLAELASVDRAICAGDVVGYNPWPAACIDITRDREIPCVSGNHDRAVAEGTAFRFNPAAKAGVDYARAELDSGDLEWLSSLPAERRLCEGRVRLVHGHPEDPDRYTFPDEFSPTMLGEEELLIMGHTHIQHAETYENGIVLNPGSVGQPRDGDPRAAYAVVDLDARDVDLCRVGYDIDRVRTAIDRAGLPPSLGERLTAGR